MKCNFATARTKNRAGPVMPLKGNSGEARLIVSSSQLEGVGAKKRER